MSVFFADENNMEKKRKIVIRRKPFDDPSAFSTVSPAEVRQARTTVGAPSVRQATCFTATTTSYRQQQLLDVAGVHYRRCS